MTLEKARVSGLSMRIGAGLDACAASYAAASELRSSAIGAGAGASPRSMSAMAMPHSAPSDTGQLCPGSPGGVMKSDCRADW